MQRKIANSLMFAIFLYFVFTIFIKTPYIAGADFFYYLLNGRDLSDGIPLPPGNYGYFPGVYWFWSFAIGILGKNLFALQIVYAMVLLLSSILCGWCVYQITNNKFSSLLSGTVCIILFHILEGLYGCIEPIAILFVLIGISGYLSFKKKNRENWAAIWLAISLGICFFFKQQGLFFLSAATTLSYSRADKKILNINIYNLLVPLLSFFTLCALLLLEGGGYTAFKTAFFLVQNYEALGTFSENILRLFDALKFLLIPLLGLSLYLIVNSYLDYRKGRRHQWITEDIQLFIFLLLCFLFPLYQFKTRGYLHYAIYCIPSLSILFGWVLSSALKAARNRQLKWALAIVLIISTFTQSRSIAIALKATHIPPYLSMDEEREKLEPFCSHLQSKDVLAIPLRLNQFYWICDTRIAPSEYGYSWIYESAHETFKLIEQKKIQNILVFSREYGPYEEEILSKEEWNSLQKTLEKNSYFEVFSNQWGTLYALQPSHP